MRNLMRKRTLGVVLLAGLALSSGGAFTFSNTDTAIDGAANKAGYSVAQTSGATILAVDYTTTANDPTTIDSLKFVAEGDLTKQEGAVVLSDADGGAPL